MPGIHFFFKSEDSAYVFHLFPDRFYIMTRKHHYSVKTYISAKFKKRLMPGIHFFFKSEDSF